MIKDYAEDNHPSHPRQTMQAAWLLAAFIGGLFIGLIL